MNVFISWSGERSGQVASLIGDWIKCVLQATKPWISSRDIDRGSLWFTEINDQLKDTTVGIVCLTQENKNKPWILFESGALAKGLSSSRVCTVLIDLKATDLEDPLAQFNHTSPDKAGMRKLVNTLNASLSSSALEGRILDQVFETYWPKFEVDFKAILDNTPVAVQAAPRTEENILSEILTTTRSLNQRIRMLESASPSSKLKGLLTDDMYSSAAESDRPQFITVRLECTADELSRFVNEAVSSGLITAHATTQIGNKASRAIYTLSAWLSPNRTLAEFEAFRSRHFDL